MRAERSREKLQLPSAGQHDRHQWWGVSVSPATKNDWWIDDGFARYSEARYVESAAGAGGAGRDGEGHVGGALAYDSVPLSSADKLDFFRRSFNRW